MKTNGEVQVHFYYSWPRHSMKVSGQIHAAAAPGNHCIRDWVGPKISPPAGIRTLVFHPVARRYTDWAIPGFKRFPRLFRSQDEVKIYRNGKWRKNFLVCRDKIKIPLMSIHRQIWTVTPDVNFTVPWAYTQNSAQYFPCAFNPWGAQPHYILLALLAWNSDIHTTRLVHAT
jgi:hypothetical protein